jgi:hypothetical protein
MFRESIMSIDDVRHYQTPSPNAAPPRAAEVHPELEENLLAGPRAAIRATFS